MVSYCGIVHVGGVGMNCKNEHVGLTCEDMFNCCDCGGNDCGCGYCWSCNACDNCKED